MKAIEIIEGFYSFRNTSDTSHPRRMSLDRSSIRQKQLQAQIEKLKRQIKDKDEQIYKYKRELDAEKNNTQYHDKIAELNNTIQSLRESLEFRESSEKQMQQHIQNYQMMNQKLREQIDKLQKNIQKSNTAMERFRKQENINTVNFSSTTLPNTPGANQRGRSPMNSDKENHPLTPKNKVIKMPKQLQMQIALGEFDHKYIKRQHAKPKLYIS